MYFCHFPKVPHLFCLQLSGEGTDDRHVDIILLDLHCTREILLYDLSYFVTFPTLFSEPNAPRNLRQAAITKNTISVQWDEPVGASGDFEYLITILEVGEPANTAVSSQYIYIKL